MIILLKIRDLIRWCIRSLCADFLEEISRIQQFNISTAEMHKKAFLPYKNKFNGRDIVIVACGPTANDYKPIEGAIHVGVNRAIFLHQVKLDFLFFMDANVARKDGTMKDFNAYRGNDCVKFYGINGYPIEDHTWVTSESDAVKANAIRYRAYDLRPMRIENLGFFHYDISTQPLADLGSVVFSAIQFALWTNPRRIYLVGCDCTATGHFDNKSWKTGLPTTSKMRRNYERLKKFAEAYYPDTEIVSVNPIGLKGVFKDNIS